MKSKTSWAVAGDYNGKVKVAPGRYETQGEVSLAVAVLIAKFGDRNFRAVRITSGQSSKDAEKWINLHRNS